METILVKMISMGDTEVGKSCLIKKYCEGNFVDDYVTTIGIDYGVKNEKVNKTTTLAVNIFDLSGDDDYKLIRKDFILDSLGVLFVYDSNISSTFDNISKWEKEAESNGLDLSKCVVLLIANKIDVKKTKNSPVINGKEYAKKKGYHFYETSAKSGVGVDECFRFFFSELFVKVSEQRSRFLY